jgi:hypothetical protein
MRWWPSTVRAALARSHPRSSVCVRSGPG